MIMLVAVSACITLLIILLNEVSLLSEVSALVTVGGSID